MGNKVVKVIAIIFLALVGMTAIVVLANFITGLTGGGGGGDLVGPTWQWTDFSDPASGQSSIPDPGAYTITFKSDGTFNAKADCNNAGGFYSTDGSAITISVQMTTMAMCPPESLSEQYLGYLNGARTFTTGPDSLRLDLVADSGSMFFDK